MKKIFFSLVLPVIFLGFFSSGVRAFEMRNGNSVLVSKDEVIDGSLFVTGSSLLIEGTVKGDLFCAGQSVTVSGVIDGDVLCAGQSVKVAGVISGNVRIAGQAVDFNGRAERNGMMFGQNIEMGRTASVTGELVLGGQKVDVFGTVGRDLYGGAENLTLNGRVMRNVSFEVDDLSFGKEASVGGNVNYTSTKDASIANRDQVSGTISRTPRVEREGAFSFRRPETFTQPIRNGGRAASLLSLLLVGILMVVLLPTRVKSVVSIMQTRTGSSFGWGLGILILTPFLVLMLILTLVGIPLAILLFILWLILIFISQIFVGIVVGQRLLEAFWKDKKELLLWEVVIGIVVTWFILGLPVIGWLLGFLAVVWGVGGIFLSFRPAKK